MYLLQEQQLQSTEEKESRELSLEARGMLWMGTSGREVGQPQASLTLVPRHHPVSLLKRRF